MSGPRPRFLLRSPCSPCSLRSPCSSCSLRSPCSPCSLRPPCSSCSLRSPCSLRPPCPLLPPCPYRVPRPGEEALDVGGLGGQRRLVRRGERPERVGHHLAACDGPECGAAALDEHERA